MLLLLLLLLLLMLLLLLVLVLLTLLLLVALARSCWLLRASFGVAATAGGLASPGTNAAPVVLHFLHPPCYQQGCESLSLRLFNRCCVAPTYDTSEGRTGYDQ